MDVQGATEHKGAQLDSKHLRDVIISPTQPATLSPNKRLGSKLIGDGGTAMNGTLLGLSDAQRRIESSKNLHLDRGNSAVVPPYPPVLMKSGMDLKPKGLLSMGEHFLDLAGIKSSKRAIQTVHVVYASPGPLYVDLFSRDAGTGAFVRGFRRKPDGSMAHTEASGKVAVNDELVEINGINVTAMVFEEIILTAKNASFPLTLTFHCFHSNRNESENKMERNYSSGPLSPVSPSSSNSSWTARLSQITRSGSFDNKTSEANEYHSTPHSPTAEIGARKFGISLDKVRNTGADGMKSLFRMMGNKTTRPEEDVNMVQQWMNDLTLIPYTSERSHENQINTYTDALHSTPITAVTTCGRFVGVLDEDRYEFVLTWFRKPLSDMNIYEIKGIDRCPYFPSVDDVGAILSLQCQSLRFPQLKRVVEMPRPLLLDPAVGNMVDVLVEAGAGSFSATLASNEHDSFQIKISAKDVTLVKISEQEDEGGIVVKAPYTAYVQVLLDAADQLRFTLKVKEFGGFLGNDPDDVCDLKRKPTQLQTLSCFVLIAQNRQHRDILTLLVRKFRARIITPEQELEAQSDERNLFMDPAFVRLAPQIAVESTTSSSGVLSPASSSTEIGDTTIPVSPATAITSVSCAIAAETSDFQTKNSINTTFSDLFGLEPDDSSVLGNDNGEMAAARAPREAITSSKIGLDDTNSNDMDVDTSFMEGRFAAREKEISMLRDKLASLSILLKVSEQENKQLTASLDLKNNRIEVQQMKIRQLEKFDERCELQARELHSLRAALKEEKQRCAEALQQIAIAAATQDSDTQTEVTANDSEYEPLTTTAKLQKKIDEQHTQIARLTDENVNLTAERNSFRTKSTELSRELRKLVEANNNRPLDDLEIQLAERSSLKTDLATMKIEATRAAIEVAEMKDLLDTLSDKDKGSKRLIVQNLEMQTMIYHLKDSLSESKDQLEEVKKINSALALRLQCLQPDPKGVVSSSSLDDVQLSSDDDDEDEDEDEEFKDGIAAFRKSLTLNC